jgi:hypothetical protein
MLDTIKFDYCHFLLDIDALYVMLTYEMINEKET